MKTCEPFILKGARHLLAFAVLTQSLQAASPGLITEAYNTSTTAAGDSLSPAFSSGDRYILFLSLANNIAPNQAGGSPFLNLFRHDLITQQTLLVNVNTSGSGGGNDNAGSPGISADGTRITFSSRADNLVSGDTNQLEDVFVRDLSLGATRRISIRQDGGNSGGSSRRPILSDNGAWVVFESTADDLTDGITNGLPNLFAHSLETGATLLLTGQGRSGSFRARFQDAAIDANGTRVAFLSDADGVAENLPQDGRVGLYIHNLTDGTTYLASTNVFLSSDLVGFAPLPPVLSLNGRGLVFGETRTLLHHDLLTGQNRVITAALEAGSAPSISADGDRVAYESGGQVYIWQAQSNDSTLVSSNHQATAAANARSHRASISSDGNSIAFLSTATDLVPALTSAVSQVYVRDLTTGTTRHVSRDNSGAAAAHAIDTVHPTLNSNGSCVVFEVAGDFTPGDHNRARDIFLHHLPTQHTRAISIAAPGFHHVTGLATPRVARDCLSADRRWLVFHGYDGNWFLNDTNQRTDIFLRDLNSQTTHLISTNQNGELSSTTASFAPVLSGNGRILACLENPPGQQFIYEPRGNPVMLDLTTGIRTTIPSTAVFYPEVASPPIVLNHEGTLCVFQSIDGIYSFDIGTSQLTLIEEDSYTPQLSRNSQWLTHYRNRVELLLTDLINETTTELGQSQWNRNDATFSASNQFLAFSESNFSGAQQNVFLRNLALGTNNLVWDNGINPALSANAHIIAIEALQPDPLDELHQLVVINTVNTTTNIVATNQSDAEPIKPVVTDDGRHVIFVSDSESLVSTPTHGIHQLYVYDTLTETVLLASINKDGTAGGNRLSSHPILGADGETVVFRSLANDLVPNDYSDRGNLYLLSLGGNDTDEDTLDDDWEVTFFGNLDQGPEDDFDNDQSSNKSEHEAGTDPTNQNSVFRVMTLTRAGGATTLLWSAVPGKTYTAQYKATANAPFWIDLPGDVTPEGSTGSITDTTAASARFYRVILK